MKHVKTTSSMGKIGLPAPIPDLVKKRWDIIVVGGGHNGLAAAAYLAKAGKQVLVLEARERIGGACTLDEPWPGIKVSPCAYVVGLLHNTVIKELALKEHGFSWFPAEGGTFVPYQDGSSLQLWLDDDKCEAEVRRFAPRDIEGWKAMRDVKRRLRDAVRPEGERDLWLNPAPTRAEIEDRLGNDDEARSLLFDWSMVEFCERYLDDERLQMAYLGQGVIGTNASPHDPGTASIHFHHVSGRLDGMDGTWGYVKGGMGMVSFYLCDAARKMGAVIAAGVPVASIQPGKGVELVSGERIEARAVVCNADPRVAIRLLGRDCDSGWKAKVQNVPIKGCTVKVNLALSELPNFKSRPGTNGPHHLGQINTPLTKSEWKKCHSIANHGMLPDKLWTEIYLHSAHDPSVAPPGVHTMSVFAQYVPFEFRDESWDTRREEVGDLAIRSIAPYCSNLPSAIIHREVLGPPDIEKKVGLTGGHIFQGEILPQYMWEKRLTPKTPMPGFYLCGAAIHPGGSVIGVNGRNAAMTVLKDLEGAKE